MDLQRHHRKTLTPRTGEDGFAAAGRSEAARHRLLATWAEPLFLADWLSAVFLHYEIPTEELQRDVPFELDLRDGRAYVSLVAFTMSRMRPRPGGRLAAWLLKPISSNRFLNVRTYVRYRGEPGIYFIREWLDNRLSVLLGPRTFGLPYRFGKLDYRCRADFPVCRFTGLSNPVELATEKSPEPADWKVCPTGRDATMRGVVRETDGGPALAYRATLPRDVQLQACVAGSLDEFLIERYLAFTSGRGKRRFFRVYHPPWPQTRIEAGVEDNSLLDRTWPWFSRATFAGAHYSPGLRDVWMGRPNRVPAKKPESRRRLSSFWGFAGV